MVFTLINWDLFTNYLQNQLYSTKILNSEYDLRYSAQQKEKQILKYAGIDIDNKEAQVLDIGIDMGNGKREKIHAIQAGNPMNPTVICLHGYWSAGVSYSKIIKPLSKNYNVYCLDWLGMGLSSRPNFNYTKSEDMINFFTNSLEAFTQTLNLKNFTLVGHSFGGFCAGHYALRHQEKVKELYLLSPLGISNLPSKTLQQAIVYYVMSGGGIMRSLFYNLFEFSWNCGLSVNGLYEQRLFPGQWLLNNYLSQSYQEESYEKQLWYQYFDKVMRLPVSSERALTGIINFPSFSVKNPLNDEFKQKLKIPVHFIYGDRDWMEKDEAKNLIQTNSIKGSYTILSNCGHNLNLDAPDQLYRKLTENFIN